MSETVVVIVLTVLIIVIIISLLLSIRRVNLYSDYSSTISSSKNLDGPQDCEGEWSDWSDCSSGCQGTRTRVFNVSQEPSGNGKKCPLSETEECNKICLNQSNLDQFFVGNQVGLAIPTSSTNLSSSQTDNPYECAQQCLNNTKCEAYGWVTDNGRCDLFDFNSASLLDFNNSESMGLPNYQVGVQIAEGKRITNDDSLNKLFDKSNQAQFGPSLNNKDSLVSRTAAGISEYTCAELCNDDETCVSYGYFTDSAVCDLYHTKQTQIGQPAWPNYRVGKKKSAGTWK